MSVDWCVCKREVGLGEFGLRIWIEKFGIGCFSEEEKGVLEDRRRKK
jgi:hypothetical protein